MSCVAGPDVGFHVPSAGFPQQQGGGAGPPSAPPLRAIHHPHHSGNPAIPPPHQPQPPQQAQSQHTGGPQGPAPTSTPPGPTEMGKQGPPHMQGQPPMQQGLCVCVCSLGTISSLFTENSVQVFDIIFHEWALLTFHNNSCHANCIKCSLESIPVH